MSHVGRFLIATPLIGDPNFERSVVFLLAHDRDGAYGFVLNKPTATAVDEVADGWQGSAAAPGVLFLGGPVRPDRVVGIGQRADPMVAYHGVAVGEVGTLDLHAPPAPGTAPWRGMRLFSGSSNWAPGQVEDEILEGSWWLADGGADDVLTTDPAGLWTRILRRQPGEVAWFANHPDDPSAN